MKPKPTLSQTTTAPPRMRVVIADHYRSVREALRSYSLRDTRTTWVGEAGCGRTAVETIRATEPDVVLLGLSLLDDEGPELIETIRSAALSRPRVLLQGSGCLAHTAYRIERVHVHGYFDLQTEPLSALRDALVAAATEKRYYSRSFYECQNKRFDDPAAYSKVLTDRELEVLQLFAHLLTDQEIADRLRISARTVELHRLSATHKLGLNSMIELLRFARDHGFMRSASGSRHPAAARRFMPAPLAGAARLLQS